MKVLSLQNRQRTKALDVAFLRQITRCVVEELLDESTYELGIHLVGSNEMAMVNQTFLQHEGSTDVITFDHTEPSETSAEHLYGEIFICIDDAIAQAKEFRTTWQSELTRYVIHGLLHLEGYDDLDPALRRKMKTQENRLLRETTKRFGLSKIQRATKKQ